MTLLIKNKDETMPSRKTRSSHLCTSPRRDGPIFLTGCDVIFSSMIQIHKKSPRALESSAPPWLTTLFFHKFPANVFREHASSRNFPGVKWRDFSLARTFLELWAVNTKNSFRELFGKVFGAFEKHTPGLSPRKPTMRGNRARGHANDGNNNQSQIRLEYDTLLRRSQWKVAYFRTLPDLIFQCKKRSGYHPRTQGLRSPWPAVGKRTTLERSPPRQNAVRMSKELSFRSVTHFRLRNEIIGKQVKLPHREVQNQKVRLRKEK